MMTRLCHRVVLQAETRTTASGGAYTTSWSTSSVEWANVAINNNLNAASEDYSHDKKQQITNYEITMRYDINITNIKRLLYNNKILVIESVHDGTGRQRMIKVKCREENL